MSINCHGDVANAKNFIQDLSKKQYTCEVNLDPNWVAMALFVPKLGENTVRDLNNMLHEAVLKNKLLWLNLHFG